jgi:ATP-dependent DNA helicase RecQ
MNTVNAFHKAHWGADSFRPAQAEAIGKVLEENSRTLVLLATGGGKSRIYQVPALAQGWKTIVISPLIALQKDQVEGIPTTLRDRVACVNSQMSAEEIKEVISRFNMQDGEEGFDDLKQVDVLYVAPERLRQAKFINTLKQAKVDFLVVDEAHCLSLWGSEFRPDYLFLGEVARELGVTRVLALTATATPGTQEAITSCFGGEWHTINHGVRRGNLRYSVEVVNHDELKMVRILELLEEAKGGASIIYADTRQACETLATRLQELGVNAAHYHAGMGKEERAATQDAFIKDELKVIIATIAFGMGVDKPNVRLVAHWSPSRSLEAYTQEAGRAGRDGLPSKCVLLLSQSDLLSMELRADHGKVSSAQIAKLYETLVVKLGKRREGVLSMAELIAQTGGDETQVRVMLSHLEKVGAITRGYDLPIGYSLTLQRPVASLNTLVVGKEYHLSTMMLCSQLKKPTVQLQRAMEIAQNKGALKAVPGPIGLHIKLTEVVEVKQVVKTLTLQLSLAERRRIQGLRTYVQAQGCRQQVISDYFEIQDSTNGQLLFDRSILGCGVCDCCRTQVVKLEVPVVAGEPVAVPEVFESSKSGWKERRQAHRARWSAYAMR